MSMKAVYVVFWDNQCLRNNWNIDFITTDLKLAEQYIIDEHDEEEEDYSHHYYIEKHELHESEEEECQ